MTFHVSLDRFKVSVCAVALVCAAASSVFAQTPADERVLLSVGFGQQSASSGFSTSRTPTIYAELAQFTERYGGKGGSTFDVSGAGRVWRGIWLGVAYGASSHTAGVDVSAQLPHPFVFNTLRSIEGTRTDLERTESDLSVHALYRLTFAERIRVSVSAGPTRIAAKQDVVDVVSYSEVYPYDSATFSGATIASASRSTTTVGVGVDVSYLVIGRVAVGVAIRYAGATVDFETPSGGTVRAKIGGTDVTGGVRFGF